MPNQVDARGLSCPEPVLLTRKLLNQLNSGNAVVTLDNHTARENVTRTAESMGWTVTVEESGTDFILHLSK
ncbi:MAG: sulfurtransferase TusA family protein [Desulfotomaculum sp.]|nr:sulfurtransferase TusA family protein [Desulfotomaculum sp.]